MTTSLSSIQKRYTRVVKMDKAYNTYLQIDHQGFCVANQVEDKKDALWYARMVAIALKRMIDSNQKPSTSS